MPDMHAGFELDALGEQLLEPPVQHRLLHFEFGDAIAQQAADAVGFFKNRYKMAGPIQLLRRRKACRTRTDNSDAFPGALGGRLRPNPAFAKSVFRSEEHTSELQSP